MLFCRLARPDDRWNCFKGNVGDTSKRRDGTHNHRLSERIDTIFELNWTESHRITSGRSCMQRSMDK